MGHATDFASFYKDAYGQFEQTHRTAGSVPLDLLMVEQDSHETVERAERMLMAGTVPLSEIAYACGFSSQPHMTSTFARLLGIPPGRLRRESDLWALPGSRSAQFPARGQGRGSRAGMAAHMLPRRSQDGGAPVEPCDRHARVRGADLVRGGGGPIAAKRDHRRHSGRAAAGAAAVPDHREGTLVGRRGHRSHALLPDGRGDGCVALSRGPGYGPFGSVALRHADPRPHLHAVDRPRRGGRPSSLSGGCAVPGHRGAARLRLRRGGADRPHGGRRTRSSPRSRRRSCTSCARGRGRTRGLARARGRGRARLPRGAW